MEQSVKEDDDYIVLCQQTINSSGTREIKDIYRDLERAP